MYNPWKLTTIGIALAVSTALVTGVTTAYFLRPASTPDVAPVAAVAPAPGVASAPASLALARRTEQATPVRTTAVPPRVASVPAVTPVATVPADCSTGADRALRIAKPGALGGLIGAGLGAAGGAVADGGKGAGKGALIGGLAGAALGSGYGAYKTKNECGTILGNGAAVNRVALP